jgi:hypothetical protein
VPFCSSCVRALGTIWAHLLSMNWGSQEKPTLLITLALHPRDCATPLTAASPSPAATSAARSRSLKAGALLHFRPRYTIAQTRSVPGPSFPNHHSPENQRSTRASLPVCRPGGAQPAPEFWPRCSDHQYYAVRSIHSTDRYEPGRSSL